MFGDIFDGEVERVTQECTFGDKSFTISCVARENQHIEKWVPLVVWHAAESFAKEMVLNPSVRALCQSRSVVELGSGTGLCGILAALLTDQLCVLTDGSEDSVEAIEASIEANGLGGRVTTVQLHWGDVPAVRALLDESHATQEGFELCIATDVIYEAAAVRPLLVSAGELIQDTHGVFLLANHKFRFMALEQEINKNLALGDVRLQLVNKRMIQGDVDLYTFRKTAE